MDITKQCLCDLKPAEIAENLEQLKKLVAEPRFICGNCGRVSSSEANLCKPLPIKA